MSKLNLYALKDTVVGAYQNPVLFHNDEEVKRSISIGLSKPNQVDDKIGDLQLYHLASYDDLTGEIVPDNYFICNLIELKVGDSSGKK